MKRTGNGLDESYLHKEILTADEACMFLGITKGYLYKLTHRHEIPYYRPNGKLIYFERTDLMAWMRRNRVATADEARSTALGYVTQGTVSPSKVTLP